eukprot:UN23127
MSEMNQNTKDGDLVGMAVTKVRRRYNMILGDITNETIQIVRRGPANMATDCDNGEHELSKRGFVYFDQVYGLSFDTVPKELNEKKYNELYLDCEIFCSLVDLKQDDEVKDFFLSKRQSLVFKYIGLHKRKDKRSVFQMIKVGEEEEFIFELLRSNNLDLAEIVLLSDSGIKINEDYSKIQMF